MGFVKERRFSVKEQAGTLPTRQHHDLASILILVGYELTSLEFPCPFGKMHTVCFKGGGDALG